jgi:hypothetical protein
MRRGARIISDSENESTEKPTNYGFSQRLALHQFSSFSNKEGLVQNWQKFLVGPKSCVDGRNTFGNWMTALKK